ncbi:MAG: DUF1501 domain-containing protein, partial [Planctomycetota bacterium]
MFRVGFGKSGKYCDGVSRRHFLQVGVAGMGAASLSQILHAKENAEQQGVKAKDTSVILLWLDGGPSHMDTYDMKPDAPLENRGIWNPIHTNVPGLEITEMFPLQAKCADKFSIVRSLHHNTGDHFTGGHWMLTGRGGVSGGSTPGRNPSIASMATKILGPRDPSMPAYVSVPYASSIGLRPGYFGGNFLGVQHDPFETDSDPNNKDFQVKNLNLAGGLSIERLKERKELLKTFDQLRKDVDQSGMLSSMDRLDQKAYEMVTGDKARQAFDLNSEDEKIREQYGRHTWGQSVLLARRLVEAGTTFVTVHFGGWDHHWNLQSGYDNYLPRVDQAVSALFEDLAQRGLSEKVLVVLCGEFSRTPRMNDGGNGGPPRSQGTRGRDHWGNSMFCLMGGGGVKGGRVIGSTNRLGDAPADRPVQPGHIHHTIYRV